MAKDGHVCGPFVRLFTESKSLSRDALGILSTSWRLGTGKRYSYHIKRFAKFGKERYTDLVQATTELEIEFLAEYFKLS